MSSEVLLENDRVMVEKIVMLPGERIAPHAAPEDRLLVFLKGGVLTLPNGRSTWWREGRVVWQSARPGGGELGASGANTGQVPIEIIGVNLKACSPRAENRPPAARASAPVDYPNVPGEDLLENERLIVQRFTVLPGQWEGVHAHHPNTLYIHIKGGQWAVRSKSEAEFTYVEASPDGEVGWMDVIALSEEHESGNAGMEPIDLIWVTLKD